MWGEAWEDRAHAIQKRIQKTSPLASPCSRLPVPAAPISCTLKASLVGPLMNLCSAE